MLGNSSHKHSEVLPKRGSLTLSIYKAGLQNQNKSPPTHQQQANAC